MKYLNAFIEKHNYELWEVLTYNSYWVEWLRDDYRPGESISISEILWLIIDPWMQFVKAYYEEEFEESCRYWTKTHWELEDNVNWKALLERDNKLHRQFKLALIKEDIVPRITERTYELKLEWLPVITWTLDVIWDIEDIEHLIDYKTWRKKRNFKSIKSQLQLSWYRKLSFIERSALLYLNQKWYDLVISKNKEYYDNIFNDLLEYAIGLYKECKTINLVNKK